MRWEKLDRQCGGCNAFRRMKPRLAYGLSLFCFSLLFIGFMHFYYRNNNIPLLEGAVLIPMALASFFGGIALLLQAEEAFHLKVLNGQIHLHLGYNAPNELILGGDDKKAWDIDLPQHLRWIRFNSASGSLVWREGDGIVHLGAIINLVINARGMASLVKAHLQLGEDMRQLYIGSVAAAVFMEETGALGRVKPLRESRTLLDHVLRDVSKSYSDSWSCEREAVRLLPQLRQELGLKYGPKASTA